MKALEDEIMICNWRVTDGVPSGVHVWFDPRTESVRLYRVPTLVKQSVGKPEGALDAGVGPGYLDRVVSVSADGDEDEDTASSREENGSPGFVQEDLPF